MAVVTGGQKMTLPAAGDFSSNGQFRFVYQDANGRGTVAGTAGQPIIGIGQNKPGAQDRGYAVQISGVSKLLIHGGVNEFERLRTNAVGAGTATSTNLHDYGAIAIEAGSSGAYIAVLVTPGREVSS